MHVEYREARMELDQIQINPVYENQLNMELLRMSLTDCFLLL